MSGRTMAYNFLPLLLLLKEAVVMLVVVLVLFTGRCSHAHRLNT